MSYSDKNEVLSKEEWLRILESKEIGRTSMNKLIMNYLVIGKSKILYKEPSHFICALF